MLRENSVTSSKEYSESIIDTVREPLIALDQDLRVVTVSRSFYGVFKVKPEETVGQLIYDLGNKQWDIPKLRELLETILPQKTTFDNYEVEHDFATIGRRIMLLNARQIERGMGKELIILLAIEDITERREIENGLIKAHEELTELAAELKRTSRVKSEFLANMSHELRTPLNSVIGFSEVLYDETFGPLNEKQKKYVNNVLTSGKHLLLLINQILDMAKVEAGKMNLVLSSLSMKSLLNEISLLVEDMVSKKALHMLLEIAEDMPNIEADELKVKEIMYNLLSNAVKFTPEGGKISMKAKIVDSEIEVVVWDSGVGIAPENYEIDKATNGEEALGKLSGNQIDLILLDVMMPGMDGFEVTRRIRQDTTHRLLPIILITALRETEDRVKGIEAGSDDFLSKPFEKMELLARVRSLLKVKAYNDLMSNYQKELEAAVTRRTEELNHALERIKSASLDTIYRLYMACEWRDEDTGAHIKRMSLYSAAVARRMGMDESTVETILYASSMHDLGKIGIPDLILMKRTRFDPVEWEIMKQHTVIGAKILKGSDVEFIRVGETIAQSHHEKYDGSGYPNGVKGTEIPIAGRIAAIADVFDALISKRHYKEPFSVEKSLSIIREKRGRHFDPDVVDAFFDIQDEILAIMKQYTDDNQQAIDLPEL